MYSHCRRRLHKVTEQCVKYLIVETLTPAAKEFLSFAMPSFQEILAKIKNWRPILAIGTPFLQEISDLFLFGFEDILINIYLFIFPEYSRRRQCAAGIHCALKFKLRPKSSFLIGFKIHMKPRKDIINLSYRRHRQRAAAAALEAERQRTYGVGGQGFDKSSVLHSHRGGIGSHHTQHSSLHKDGNE